MIILQMDKGIVCRFCRKVFTHKRNVYQHIRKVHKVVPPLRITIRCPECDKPCGRRTDVRNHLQKDHDIEQLSERISFSSFEAFNRWKLEREKTTHCSYVKANGMHMTSTGKKIYFHCHRSGIFKSKSTGKRKLKSQGTNKLGKLCPASIEITELEDGTIDGTFWKTHVGHLPDIERFPLPDEERIMIAGKLLDGVDERKIIQDYKLSMNTEIERKHIMTKDDLKNIKQCFGIKTNLCLKESETEDDEQSVANWVEEMYQNDYNPVLLYKRQNEMHPLLNFEDFLLIFMTAFQKTMLIEFEYDRVCINTIDSVSDQGFHLVVMILANKYEEGVPIALCLTSTIDQHSLQLFFNCVKEVAPELRPTIFISEDSPVFYDAWEEIFESCEEQLLCTWKVDQEWRHRLNAIKRKNKRDEIYKALKNLMYEFDEDVFQELLDGFLVQIMEEETQEFYEYFAAYYHSRSQMWAYCFRKSAVTESLYHIRTFQENLKQLCLHRRKPRRTDDLILKLIDLVNHKKFHDFLKSQIEQKNKVTDDDHHDNSLSNIQSQDNWTNYPNSNDQTFQITKNHICDSRCKLCLSVEGYKCTCFDYSISKFNCKHIPFMLRCIETGDIGLLNESDLCEQSLFTSDQKESLKLESVKLQVSSICRKLNNVTNMDYRTERKLQTVFNIVEHLVQPLLLKMHRNSTNRRRRKVLPSEHSIKNTENGSELTTGNLVSTDSATINDSIIIPDSNKDHVYYSEESDAYS